MLVHLEAIEGLKRSEHSLFCRRETASLKSAPAMHRYLNTMSGSALTRFRPARSMLALFGKVAPNRWLSALGDLLEPVSDTPTREE